VILHGFQGSAKRNFIPWLKKELEARGHEVEALELPNSDHPHESEQVGHVIKNCKFDENTVVIAHSLGSVVALKALMKMNKKISGLVLVASAVSPSFSTDNEERPYWKDFNWDFDYGQIQKLTDGKIAVLSDKKETKRATYLKDLSTKLEAILIEVNSNEEHFCAEEEPEILRSVTPYVKVFTTRPDTLFGVTYIVLAPEHPWVQLMTPLLDNRKEVEDYVSKVKKETNMERTDASKEKTGIQLKGIVAVNPANNEEVPVWIADYVLSDYGTGAVMAVPAHDERDHTFAKKFGLPIKNVIESSSVNTESTDKVYTGEGILVNSVLFNGRESGSAKKEIAEFVGGKWVTTFKLRDWIFSRQRYWGEPIPVVHCELHGIVPVPEKDLPVKLPKVKNYKPTETGESPLASISKWVNTKCPQCLADKKKTKYLIFDFDGVLGDTWDVMNHAKVKMGEASTVEEAGQRALEHFSRKPFDARSENQTPEQRQKRQDWIRTFGNHLVQSEFGLFDVFIKQLKKIKNVKLAVVSSGSAQYILPAIKKSGLKFTHILAHEDHHSKEEKVEKVCRDWGISVKDPYYFTDTKADIYELEGIMGRERIIGCSWGYHGYDGLNELLPDKQILRHFNDIHRLFNQDCKATRETDTMPNWAGSSWYYLRYTDPNNKKEFADSKKLKYWTPVDWYNGGMEHTTLHLLYSRFWHKFLFDLGLVPTSEPYQKRTSHGLILAQGGEKMSKSKGNVINPDSIVEKVGADSLRLYEMFMGPFDQPIAWNTDNIAGVRRFIERVWKLYFSVIPAKAGIQEVNKGMDPNFRRDDNTGIKIHNSADKIIHKTIKKVSEDIEAMRFNTAISSMMIALNDLEKFSEISQKSYETFIQLLAPFAPHVCEELWWSLGHKQSIGSAPWPVYDPKLAVDSETNITVQVNGKMRASFMASIDTSKEELEKMARALPDVSKWLEGKRVVKVVVVPNRLINIVVA
jgi:leucyl-tRNA synthetase/phosphoglycolate phosphatase-like HAD superfamily hydrolase